MQTIMENDCGEVLGEILRKLAPLFEKRSLFRKEFLSSISEISTRISANPPTVEEFAVFCFEIHDWLVKFDSPLRAMLLRVLRLSISSSGSTTYSQQTYVRRVHLFVKYPCTKILTSEAFTIIIETSFICFPVKTSGTSELTMFFVLCCYYS